jgi:hypothetical protein
MGQEPAELRREIEQRREELGDTIDAIGDRVSPGRIIERRRNRMSEGFRSLKDRVMGTVSNASDAVGDAAGSVRDHVGPGAVKGQTAGSPIGAGMVAFGIGFLVAAALPANQPEVDAAHKAEDALEPAKDALVETAQNVGSSLKDRAVDAAQQVKETATGAAGEIATTAKQEAAATKDDAQRATS